MGKAPVRRSRSYSDEDLLEELRRVAAEHPRARLTQMAFEEYSGRVSSKTITNRFAGWKKALEAAGLGHLYCGPMITTKMLAQSGTGISETEVIAELRRVYALVGKEHLTTLDFDVRATCSPRTVRTRFGSWSNALRQAGLPTEKAAQEQRHGSAERD
jgi:hypothetical protein